MGFIYIYIYIHRTQIFNTMALSDLLLFGKDWYESRSFLFGDNDVPEIDSGGEKELVSITSANKRIGKKRHRATNRKDVDVEYDEEIVRAARKTFEEKVVTSAKTTNAGREMEKLQRDSPLNCWFLSNGPPNFAKISKKRKSVSEKDVPTQKEKKRKIDRKKSPASRSPRRENEAAGVTTPQKEKSSDRKGGKISPLMQDLIDSVKSEQNAAISFSEKLIRTIKSGFT